MLLNTTTHPSPTVVKTRPFRSFAVSALPGFLPMTQISRKGDYLSRLLPTSLLEPDVSASTAGMKSTGEPSVNTHFKENGAFGGFNVFL